MSREAHVPFCEGLLGKFQRSTLLTFREDESRIRKGNGALVFNVLRKLALNLFKQDDSVKASVARKKKMATLDDEYRSVLLESLIKMR